MLLSMDVKRAQQLTAACISYERIWRSHPWYKVRPLYKLLEEWRINW